MCEECAIVHWAWEDNDNPVQGIGQDSVCPVCNQKVVVRVRRLENNPFIAKGLVDKEDGDKHPYRNPLLWLCSMLRGKKWKHYEVNKCMADYRQRRKNAR
jgi:hypothetical protein